AASLARSQIERAVMKATIPAIVAMTLSAGGALAQNPGETSRQLEDLRRQVQELQRQIDEMRTQQRATAKQAQSAPTSAQAPDRAATDTAGIQAGPLTITFGGFAELAGVYRNRNEKAGGSRNFNKLNPFYNFPPDP